MNLRELYKRDRVAESIYSLEILLYNLGIDRGSEPISSFKFAQKYKHLWTKKEDVDERCEITESKPRF